MLKGWSLKHLEPKWLTKKDLEERGEGWLKISDGYFFELALGHLFIYDYDLVIFQIEVN